MDRLIVIHYGELSTKGDNRKLFVDALFRNIKWALRDVEGLEFEKGQEHSYVRLHEKDVDRVFSLLMEIPGIQRLSLGCSCSTDLDSICEASWNELSKMEASSFKVEVKRVDKTYPMDSYEIARKVGGYLLGKGAPKVDVHDPDVKVKVEIRPKVAYVTLREEMGAGGYPLGMNGKVMTLLSGGIDSPVAAYHLIRRGLIVECIHFAAPPYTSEAVIDKLRDIMEKLGHYQSRIKLHVVPFTKLQEAIYRYVDEPYCITIMRRMMLRIASIAAEKYHCKAIGTGESIGQVASQTLESLYTINAVSSTPVIRPLAVTDKLEIIKTAKRIGTYEISIRPYEDCCTIFKPKKPKTKPKIKEAEYFEGKFDYQAYIDEAIEGIYDIEYPFVDDLANL